MYFNGTGVDSTEMFAAPGTATDKIVITGGRMSLSAAGRLDILSATTVRDSIEFAARATARMPVGLEMLAGQKLSLQIDAGTARGWISAAVISSQDSLPQVDIAQ